MVSACFSKKYLFKNAINQKVVQVFGVYTNKKFGNTNVSKYKQIQRC